MTTRFSDISADSENGALRVRFRLRVRGASTSESEQGLVLGYQVLDPQTGCYLQEGEHRPLPPLDDRNAAETPSDQHEILLAPSILPRGHLRVVVSLLGPKGWQYRQGDDYLQLDLDNQGDTLEKQAMRVSSLARESLPRLFRTVSQAFQLPLRSIIRNQQLIRTMVRRDLLGRYRGSTAGALWSVLNPLLMMATYYFVFGVVLQARFGGDPSREGFVLYFLAGMLPWLPFSEALGRAPAVLLEYANFIKKLVFPVETLPVNLVASGLVLQSFAVAIFLLGLLFFRGSIPLSAFWLPVLLIPQLLLTTGFCWIFATLGILFRDLVQIMGYLLTLWFFLTPICYPKESLPPAVAPYLAMNPFYVLVQAYRDVLLEGIAPNMVALGWLTAGSLLVFIGGHALFHRMRRSFADLL